MFPKDLEFLEGLPPIAEPTSFDDMLSTAEDASPKVIVLLDPPPRVDPNSRYDHNPHFIHNVDFRVTRKKFAFGGDVMRVQEPPDGHVWDPESNRWRTLLPDEKSDFYVYREPLLNNMDTKRHEIFISKMRFEV